MTPLSTKRDWVALKREAKVDHEAIQSKADLFRRFTTSEVTNANQIQNTNFSQLVTAWIDDVECHAEQCIERAIL